MSSYLSFRAQIPCADLLYSSTVGFRTDESLRGSLESDVGDLQIITY